MRKTLTAALIIFAVLTFGSAHANLIDNGGGLIYDTDLDITWYDNPNYAAGSGYYPNDAAWAAGLNVGGVTGWRLPTTDNYTIGTPSNAGELGHLFVDELGNSTTFANKGPFTNFIDGPYLNAFYTQTTLNGYQYFVYHFQTGTQYLVDINYSYYWIQGLAVHDGNIGGSPVPTPEPATMLLLGLGLIGLVGVRRKLS